MLNCPLNALKEATYLRHLYPFIIFGYRGKSVVSFFSNIILICFLRYNNFTKQSEKKTNILDTNRISSFGVSREFKLVRND